MAELNLIKASYTGKLGETYGASWKGIPVIRAVPFSKAPPTELQTASVRAFECLNRLSAQISKMGFPYLGLDSYGLHKHNAVAKFLKPAIRGSVFNPINIQEVIPLGDAISIVGFVHNRSLSVCTVKLQISPDFQPLPGQKIFLLVFDSLGRVYYNPLLATEDLTASFPLTFEDNLVYYAMVFLSSPSKNGYILSDFNLRQGLGMQYSLDEQLTGDLWLNGEPIYIRTFKDSPTFTGPGDFTIIVSTDVDIKILVDHAIFISGGSHNMAGPTIGNIPAVSVSPDQGTLTNESWFISCKYDPYNKRLILYGSNNFTVYGFEYYLTVKYVKNQ